MFLPPCRLTREEPQVRRDIVQERLHFVHVKTGIQQLMFGLVALQLILTKPQNFFQHRPAVFGRRPHKKIAVSLIDNAKSFGSQTRLCKKINDVLQPHLRVV